MITKIFGGKVVNNRKIEEKNMDLSEVDSQVMSKKSYMKKWRGLTDDEVQEELKQIALERQIIEDSAIMGEGLPYPDEDAEDDIMEDDYVEGEEDVDLDSEDGISDEERSAQNDLLSELDALLTELGG